ALDPAGNHVRRSGERGDPPDGSHLPARLAGDDAIHGLDETRRGEEGVVPVAHRRRARVVLESRDRDVPLAKSDDPLDDPDVELLLLQRAALLDVQLQVGGDAPLGESRALEMVRIAAEERDSLTDRLAAAAHRRKVGGGQYGGGGMASAVAAFLVLPDRHDERVARRDVLL